MRSATARRRSLQNSQRRRQLQVENLEERRVMAYVDTVLAMNPVLFYQFNEASGTTAVDSTANGNNGTFTAGASRVAGRANAGTALQVNAADGTPDAVMVNNANTALASISANNQVTISFWFQNNNAPVDSTSFGATTTTGARLQSHLTWSNSTIYWDAGGCCNADGRISIAPSAAVVSSFQTQWNQMTYVKDGVNDTASIYLNGKLLLAGTGSAQDLAPITNFFVGATALNFGAGDSGQSGKFDDFAIFNRALSDVEIQRLASTYVDWTGAAGDGNWNTPANWSGGNVPDSALEVAVFNNTGAGAVAIGANNFGIGGVEFRNTTGSYTINATTGSITAPEISQFGSSSNTINATLNLSGANLSSALAGSTLTVSGAVNVGAETLNISGSGNVSILGNITAGAFGRYVSVKNLPDYARLLHISEIEAFLVGVTPAASFDNANDVAWVNNGASVKATIGPLAHGATSALIDGVGQGGAATYTLDTAFSNEDIIDFGQNRFIGSVRLWQRNDGCCQERLENVLVSILSDAGGQPNAVSGARQLYGDVPTNSSGTVAFQARLVKNGTGTLTLGGNNNYAGGTSINAGQLVIANVAGSATGSGPVSIGAVAAQARFIRIHANNDQSNRFFGFGEAEAFLRGVTPNPADVDPNDLALVSKGASIEYDNFVVGGGHGTAVSILDGIRDTGGVTWTRQGVSPEIMVDLGQQRDLGQVRFWQRNDGCCQDRLSNFTVSLYADSGAGLPGARVFSQSFPGQATTNGNAAFVIPNVAASTATLSGSGRISGAVTVTAGSTIAPGVTAMKIANGGFETPYIGNANYIYSTIPGSVWTQGPATPGNGSGVSTNGSAFGSTAPEGQSVAFIQNTGFAETTLNGLTAGREYTMTWSMAARGGNNSQVLQVTVDGQLIGGGRAYDQTYRDYTSTSFIATGPTATLRLFGTNTAGDQTVFVDNIRLNALTPVSTPTLVNASFEDGPTNLPFPEYGAILNGWASNIVGTGTNNTGGPFDGGATIPDGTRAAFIQNAGVLSQNIRGLTVGKQYQIEYFENARGGNTTQNSVRVGGVTLVPQHAVVRTQTNAFTRVITQPFTATSSTMLLELVNSAAPDNTALYDNVRIIEKIAPVVTNGGFENPDTATFAELTTPTGWTSTGVGPPAAAGAGVVENNGPYGGPNAIEGSQRGLLKGTSSLSQAVSGFVVGNRYSVTYSYVERLNNGGEASVMQVSVGGNVVDGPFTVTTGNANFQTRTVNFVATAPTMTLAFANLNNSPLGRADGDNSIFLDDVFVRYVNAAPTIASAGGPYSISEGQNLVLNGTPAVDADGDAIANYGWDLNNDGVYTDASGPTPTVTWPQLVALGIRDNGSFTARARATDSTGLTSVPATAPLTVINANPTAVIIDGPTQGVPGLPLSFTFSILDPSPVDAAGTSNATFDIDWDNDGTVDETVVGPANGTTVEHTYTSLGAVTLAVTGTDKDGGVSPVATADVNILAAIEDGNGNVVVGGTDNADRIIITLGAGIQVRMNNKLLGNFSASNKVIVYGNDGSDTITVSGSANVDVEFYGGEGDDYLTGGNGNDLLDGGNGNDRLLGGAGSDTLTGGDGADKLSGGNGNDFLYGDAGNDNLSGDAGNDTENGGDGNDTVNGGTGNDILHGDDGIDNMSGDAGNDILVGGAGSDKMYGRDGRDLLLGGLDFDLLVGGAGDDLLVGDATDIDDDNAQLEQVMALLLSSGIGADYSTYFNPGSVTPLTADQLIGETGNDLFIASRNDSIKDKKLGDILEYLD